MKLLKRLVSVLAIVLAVGSNAFAGDEVRIVIDEGLMVRALLLSCHLLVLHQKILAKLLQMIYVTVVSLIPIAVSQMPQRPTSAAEVNPEAWSNIGIDAIVIGQVVPSGNGYSITYQLIDTVGASGTPGTVLMQNSYTVTNKWLRYGAHTVSDEVFEKLTAIRGAFRTRIAYVVQKKWRFATL